MLDVFKAYYYGYYLPFFFFPENPKSKIIFLVFWKMNQILFLPKKKGVKWSFSPKTTKKKKKADLYVLTNVFQTE